MSTVSVCACGHTAHWHGALGCEHDAACRCESLRDPVAGPPTFMVTDAGFVVQELGDDGNYRMVARVVNGDGERIVALLNGAAA